jgi:cytochrome c556
MTTKSIPGLGESMKPRSLLILGLALCVTGCAEKEAPAPEPASEPASEPKAATPAPAEAPAAEEPSSRGEDFIDHMHAHAEQLDNLNFALADDDLEGAMTAAYWLSGHQEVSGLEEEWRPFLEGMREAAQAVEEAPDLDAARAALERINENCQGCHEAAGVSD